MFLYADLIKGEFAMKNEKNRKKVLFICTHNSARSQMAEGFLNALKGDKYEAYSAGVEPSGLNPCAVKVMQEIGIDISTHRSKSINEFYGVKFDYVVTVCEQTEGCPLFLGGEKYIHKSFEDSSKFKGSEEEVVKAFRRVRDQIKDWIEKTF